MKRDESMKDLLVKPVFKIIVEGLVFGTILTLILYHKSPSLESFSKSVDFGINAIEWGMRLWAICLALKAFDVMFQIGGKFNENFSNHIDKAFDITSGWFKSVLTFAFGAILAVLILWLRIEPSTLSLKYLFKFIHSALLCLTYAYIIELLQNHVLVTRRRTGFLYRTRHG